eukprot:m.13682 g.13682  ORF g.13682 m.13682 type:complete len:236 (+) comp3319_c0_seq1:128-835(+)
MALALRRLLHCTASAAAAEVPPGWRALLERAVAAAVGGSNGQHQQIVDAIADRNFAAVDRTLATRVALTIGSAPPGPFQVTALNSAKELLKLADEADLTAKFNLASIILRTDSSEDELKLARGSFKDLAVRGHGLSMMALAQMYASGRGVEQKPELALKLLKEACQHNTPFAPTQLGLLLRDLAPPLQDYSEAVACFRRGAEEGGSGAHFAVSESALSAQTHSRRLQGTLLPMLV